MLGKGTLTLSSALAIKNTQKKKEKHKKGKPEKHRKNPQKIGAKILNLVPPQKRRSEASETDTKGKVTKGYKMFKTKNM